VTKTFRFSKINVSQSVFVPVSLILFLFFNFSSYVHSQCNPYVFEVNNGISIILPNVVKIAIVDSSKPGASPFLAIDIPADNLRDRTWIITQPNIDDIQTIIDRVKENNIDRALVKAGWLGPDNAIIGGSSGLKAFKLKGETDADVCGQSTPVVPPTPPAANTATPAKMTSSMNETGELWNEWLAEIEADLRTQYKSNKNYVAILFDQDLEVTKVSRDYGAVGDLLYVGVLRNEKDPTGGVSVGFSPCDLESAAPNIYVGGTLDIPGKQAAEDVFVIDKFPPRRCYNSVVTIQVEKKGLDPNTNAQVTATGQYVWQQYQRYKATLQLGILFTDLQDQTYGLLAEGDKTVIYSKGPENTGPSYVASLVIYSFPRYIAGIFSSKSRFQGRDILHDNDFIDRIGAVLSVGVDNPGRRFSFGLSFELLYGINLVGVYEFARITELAGLEVGDEFSGTVDTIPTHDVWKEKLTFGLSIDLRYVTALFSKK